MTDTTLSNLSTTRRRAIAALLIAAAAGLLVLALWPSRTIPDFTQYEAGPARKSAFFEFLRPIVADANAALAADRTRLLEIADDGAPGFLDRRWLRRTAERFGVDYDPDAPMAVVGPLKRRLDTVPVSLALAQAAKESGWGTSRFARAGNNLFGEWCFQPGCGIVPAQRAPGRVHEVEQFDSPRESVESYLRTLNTHPAYRELRAARARARQQGTPVSGLALAAGLSRYSERGQAYVDDIRGLIRFNDLE